MKGIYKIECNKNNYVYIGAIGADNKTFEKRFQEHKGLLNNNRHYNKNLQKDWNKFGSESFSFSIIKKIDNNEDLVKLEKEAILSFPKFYNKSLNTEFSCFGHSKETRNLISKKNKGKTLGIKHNNEHNTKISNTLKERFKNKENHPSYNKKLTDETKQKIREKRIKYSFESFLEVKKLLLKNYKGIEISKITGLPTNLISNIKNGKSYYSKELGGGLNEWR